MPEPIKPLRIAHPFSNIPMAKRHRMQSAISENINTYLFKRILPESGHQAAILAVCVKRFYEECLRRGIGLPPGEADESKARWDENNEALAASVLADLNFEKPKTKKVKP